jgi:hypothetical protein
MSDLFDGLRREHEEELKCRQWVHQPRPDGLDWLSPSGERLTFDQAVKRRS